MTADMCLASCMLYYWTSSSLQCCYAHMFYSLCFSPIPPKAMNSKTEWKCQNYTYSLTLTHTHTHLHACTHTHTHAHTTHTHTCMHARTHTHHTHIHTHTCTHTHLYTHTHTHTVLEYSSPLKCIDYFVCNFGKFCTIHRD